MSRKIFFASILFFMTAIQVSNAAEQEKPNVVILFADDMGYADGIGKTEIPIPNLQKLYDSGVSFTDAYVTAPVCTPSRVGLWNGCYQQRLGIFGHVHGKEVHKLALKRTLMSSVFQKAGYRTGLVGKWHMSGNNSKRFDYGAPRDRGIDDFVGIFSGGSSFVKGVTVRRNGKLEKTPNYLTDFWGDEACKFIKKNKKKPFFLFVGFNAVHAPLEALKADINSVPNKGKYRQIYGGMMVALDRNVGRIVKTLDAEGLSKNTIVIFLNDNGGGGSTKEYAHHSLNYANNSPYKGYKFDIHEGGIRTPMSIKWPGHITPKTVYKKQISSMDIYPTIVNAAGLKMPKQPHDGVDLIPYLKPNNNSTPHKYLYWENISYVKSPPPKRYRSPAWVLQPKRHIHNSAIRRDQWKLVRLLKDIDSPKSNPAWKLYDLSTDVSESKDVAAKHPKIVTELKTQFKKWQATLPPSREE